MDLRIQLPCKERGKKKNKQPSSLFIFKCYLQCKSAGGSEVSSLVCCCHIQLSCSRSQAFPAAVASPVRAPHRAGGCGGAPVWRRANCHPALLLGSDRSTELKTLHLGGRKAKRRVSCCLTLTLPPCPYPSPAAVWSGAFLGMRCTGL